MRRYQRQKFEVFNLDGTPTNQMAWVPSPKALKNFKKYLNRHELAVYNKLPGIVQLSVRLSVDPFRSFQEVYPMHANGVKLKRRKRGKSIKRKA